MYSKKVELVKVTLHPYTITVDMGRNYDSLSINQALSNLNNNNASLLYTDFYDSDTLSVNTIKGDMSAASIEYRFDVASGTVYPYYQFEGLVETSKMPKVRTEYLTPAIQTNFDEQ